MLLPMTVRRILAWVLALRTTSRMPLRGFSAGDPAVTAVNDAKRFRPKGFSLGTLHWTAADDDAAARPAMEAAGLGLHWTARPGRTVTVLAPTPGVMVCERRAQDGVVVEQRLTTYLSDADLAQLRARPTPDGEEFAVDNARLVCSMGSAMAARFAGVMHDHHGEGRLEAVVAGDLDRRRGEEQIGDDVPAELDTAVQLDLWLQGQGAVQWRFARGVGQDESVLGELASGETFVLYAEVMGQAPGTSKPSWYRINSGLVLDRLRGRDDGFDAEYDLLTDGYRDGGVASGGAPTARSELCVVRGGSLGSVVLQPFGVVPATLFSFATCDPIHLFGAVLGDDRPLSLRTSSPTIPRAALARVWRTHGIQHERLVTGPGAVEEFPATDYADQVSVDKGHAPRRPQEFYDDLAQEVTYGAMGWSGGAVAGKGLERTLVPQGDVASRPNHPRWTPQRALQLRRLFPLRFTVRLGTEAATSHEFTLTQDERDCLRQEYAFHMYFTEPYFQTYRWLWKTQELHAARVFPTRIPGAPHQLEIGPDGRAIRPALGIDALITVPRRADLQPWYGRDTAYHHTLLIPTADELLEEVRAAAQVYAQETVDVLQAFTENRPAPAVSMPDYSVAAVTRIATLLAGSPQPRNTAGGFLQLQLGRADAISRLARPNVNGKFELRPYRLDISSGWRPPEHNESVSVTPISNHQLGEAMDIQPAGAGPGSRSPLALLCLHLAAQDLDDAGRLRECLLEQQANEYIVGHVDEAKRDRTVVENVLPDGSRVYVLRGPGLANEPFSDVASFDGEQITSKTRLDLKLARTYREEFDQLNGTSGPWPAPTYLDMYIFGLCIASHVHHTWKL